MTHREIAARTQALRKSADPQWVRIRELLLEKGIDPLRAILAYEEAEAPFYDVGVVVGAEGGVFHYAFDWLNREVSRGRITEWDDLTGSWASTPHRKLVELALQLVAAESPTGEDLESNP